MLLPCVLVRALSGSDTAAFPAEPSHHHDPAKIASSGSMNFQPVNFAVFSKVFAIK